MTNENKSSGFKNKQDQHQKQDIEIKERLKQIRNKVLVMSRKGGLGKSSVAAYLSVTLAKKDYRVGLMDVDLHGPSIPRILGLEGNIGTGRGMGRGGGGRGQGGGGRGLGGGSAAGPGGYCVCPNCGERATYQLGNLCYEQIEEEDKSGC